MEKEKENFYTKRISLLITFSLNFQDFTFNTLSPHERIKNKEKGKKEKGQNKNQK